MLSINKSYFYIFLFSIISLFVSRTIFKQADELMLMFMILLAGCDIVLNRNYRSYKLLFALMAVMSFYLIYSAFASPFNSFKAQLNDYILQSKPLVAFALSYALVPRFTPKEKYIIKITCIIISILCTLILLAGLTEQLLQHVYYQGLACVTCALTYLFLSYNPNLEKKFKKSDIVWVISMMTMGLACTRAKYYGFFVLSLYLLFVYRPGTVNLKNTRNLIITLGTLALVILVAWEKITYYFIPDTTSGFDADKLETFARPVLYSGSLLVFADYPILGSGLASYATFSSSTGVQYSSLYHDYGISIVYGLSPEYDAFICDTFYPELAQFGLVGVFFFLTFCWWIWRKNRLILRVYDPQFFIIPIFALSILAIDGTSSCSILQIYGQILMMIMGICAGLVKHIPKAEAKALLNQNITTFYNKNDKIKTTQYGKEF